MIIFPQPLWIVMKPGWAAAVEPQALVLTCCTKLFQHMVEKQVCPASVLIPFPSNGWRSPSAFLVCHLPLHAACLSLLTLCPHLLFTVQQRCRWLLENHAYSICTWNRDRLEGGRLWNHFVTIGTKTRFLCVFFTKMTSNNKLWRSYKCRA